MTRLIVIMGDDATYEISRGDMLAECRRQQINIFPLQPRSKVPMQAWKQFQSENFDGNIPDECNFAVICGDISENLAVFDFDNCNDIDLLNCLLPKNSHVSIKDNTLVVKTSRGYHVYLKLDKTIKNMKMTKDDMFIDVQSTGKYVVAPTSIHPSGMLYEVVSTTTTVKQMFGKEILECLSENGFIFSVTENGDKQGGKDVAKGGIKYGSIHNSFVKFCNFTILTAGITDRHTYDQLCENWNRQGNNEYQMDDRDFTVTRNDCWNWCMKQAEKDGEPSEKNDGKKENPTHYSERVMQELTFKTLADTKEILYYTDGVYLLGGERRIEEICQRMIPECGINDVREVLAIVQRSTYVDRTDFDIDPYKINLINCIVDVLTGEISEHSPNKLHRNQVPVIYDESAMAVEVPKFLRECHTEPKTILKLIEEAAYVLLREPLFQVAFMYTGIGSNGKSVWLDWILDFFGKENACEVSLHDFVVNRFKAAELDGKLLNVYADIKSDALKQNETLKPLISGDRMTVEKKNQHPFTLKPYAKMFFSANQIPEMHDTSLAMYRRLSLTRWDIVWTEETKDVDKLSKMSTEMEKSGMLNMFLRTLRKLIKRGNFSNPLSMEERKNTWQVEADPVIEFVRLKVMVDKNKSIDGDELWQAFEDYGHDAKISKNVFNRKIVSLTRAKRERTRSSKSHYGYTWYGISLYTTVTKSGQTILGDDD